MAGFYGDWAFRYQPTNPFANQSSQTRAPIQEEIFRDPKNVSAYAINGIRNQGASNSFQRFFENWAPAQELPYNAMIQDNPTSQTSFADFFRDRLARASQDYLNTNPFYNQSLFARPTRIVRRR